MIPTKKAMSPSMNLEVQILRYCSDPLKHESHQSFLDAMNLDRLSICLADQPYHKECKINNGIVSICVIGCYQFAFFFVNSNYLLTRMLVIALCIGQIQRKKNSGVSKRLSNFRKLRRRVTVFSVSKWPIEKMEGHYQ